MLSFTWLVKNTIDWTVVRLIVREVNDTSFSHNATQPLTPEEVIKDREMANPKLFMAAGVVNLELVPRSRKPKII